MKYYAVIGNPIEHSLSPIIHHTFAQNCRIDLNYEKYPVKAEALKDTIHKLSKTHAGLNVTLPYKEAVLPLCTLLTPRATRARAANTIIFHDNGSIVGDNTDGVGLLQDFINLNIPVYNQTLLIVGAGGAARGILPTVMDQHPKKIVIANRTAHKAHQLAQDFSITGKGLDEIPKDNFDLIINTTAMGQDHIPADLPTISAGDQAIFYDINYSDNGVMKDWAHNFGATYYDGLGMLVEQAACAFGVWHDITPDTKGIVASLRERLICL